MPVGPFKKHPEILEKLEEIQLALKGKGIRAKLDDTDQTAGFKFNKWEQKGAALRVELGPRDYQNGQAIVKARDEEEKQTVSLAQLITVIEEELEVMQTRLLTKARAFRDAHSHTAIDTMTQLEQHIEANKVPGWILAGWCGSVECEQR